MVRLFSPAKINVFFRILAKRSDGFHEISSLYHALSLGDFLTFEPVHEDRFTTDSQSLFWDDSNLIKRALDLFRLKTSIHIPVSIHLEKKIPMQSGLGGGSSNAATTLFALNQLFDAKIEEKTLAQWGGELGSDVPFFFSSGSAYCTGRGEKIEPLEWALRKEVWVAFPSYGLSTPQVYRHCKPGGISLKEPLLLLRELQDQNVSACVNDLEMPAFSLEPRLRFLKRDLENLGFASVTMTGSGSAFFCFGAPQSENLPDVRLLKCSFISRKKENWYSFS